MTLDATARKANILDSIKQYFVDELYNNRTGSNKIDISFDRFIASPNLQTHTITRWVSVNMGDIEIKSMSDIKVKIYACTRKDDEGFRNAQLVDTLMEILSDSTKPHGMRNIPFYQSRAAGSWTSLGSLQVSEVITSGDLFADDGTRYVILNVTLRTASKI